ncbi:TPA: hypothetical protein DF272_00495 [Candidatus Falkowbacteria bacterium]|nr:hypothetical protein [Candidatus Falkowbacteria bacterium]
MTKKISIFLMMAVMAVVLVLPVVVAAQSGDVFGVNAVGSELALGSKDIRETVGSIINVALGFLGVVAIVIVLIGGFKYMTAGGDETKVGTARKYIISGIIGLAIILSAYAITTFVISRLMTATESGT